MPRKIYITQNDEDYDIWKDVVTKLKRKGAKIFNIQGNHTEWEIIDNIKKCQFIWLVTKNSVHGSGCTLEVMAVLERAFRQNKINAVLLMYDDVKDQLLKLSVLDVMVKIPMRLNRDGSWQESQVDDVMTVLAKGDQDVRSRIPAGNLSHGFAYSHFFGFHNMVLNEFEGKIKKSSWYKDNPRRFPLKIYELVPQSCRTAFNITDKDPRVKYVGTLEQIDVIRAGNKGRPYTLRVYTLNDNGTNYYFVAQFPNAISAMVGMKDKQLARMNDVDIMVQLTRYNYTMERLLKHPKHKHFHDKVRLLLYNDKSESPFDVLLTAIKKDVATNQKLVNDTHSGYNLNIPGILPYEKLCPKVQPKDSHLHSTGILKQFDACIVHCSDSETDNNTSVKIKQALEQQHVKLFTENIAMCRSQSLQEAVKNSRWIVLILSKEALANRTFFEPSWIASEVNTTKSVMVIPVLVDVTADEIPDMLNWLLYIHVHPNDVGKTKQFDQEMKSLCNYIKGMNMEVSFENYLPAGDIGYGLAWGYALNYLPVVLKDFQNYISGAFRREGITDYICPRKLYIVVPKTCRATGLLDQNDRVKHRFKLVQKITERAITNIIQTLDVYSVSDTNRKMYYFVGQYPAAVTCLYEMMELGSAGLTEDDMRKESANFCRTVQLILEQVLSNQEISRCQFLDFDDTEPTGLADALISKIEEQLS